MQFGELESTVQGPLVMVKSGGVGGGGGGGGGGVSKAAPIIMVDTSNDLNAAPGFAAFVL